MGLNITRKYQDGSLQSGTVLKILNLEGLNTMFLVQFPEKQEAFRLIYDYINNDVWINADHEEPNNYNYVQ